MSTLKRNATTTRARLAALLALLLAAWAPLMAGEAPKVEPAKDGLKIDAGDFGAFTLTWPRLALAAGEEKPQDVTLDGNKAALKYACGATLEVTVDGGDVALKFAGLPAGAEKFLTDMVIPNGFAGANWKVAGETAGAGAFPKDKPEKPHLFQGNAKTLTFSDPKGRSMTVTAPAYTFIQLQDNREWNWEVYQMCLFTPITPNTTDYSLSFSVMAGGK